METLLSSYRQQAAETDPGRILLTTVDSRLQSVSYTFRELDELSSKAAECLRSLDCRRGDRVLISAGSSLQIRIFFWGALKLGAVPCVLFPGLGTGGLSVRLRAADACFLVTDADPLKLSGAVCLPDSLKRIILLGKPSEDPLFFVWHAEDWSGIRESENADPDDPAFIVFTSGTTGTPKPVVHRHGIAEAVIRSMRDILHADPSDTYWCTAHPAWITGTVYGLIGPALCGIHSIQYDGSFHAKRWMPILQDRKVTLWYTAPTALRGLMREETSFFEQFDLSALKQIYSIGEPLPVKVFEWGRAVFHQPVYDTWFQTETGTIRIANGPGRPLIPGWMGKPVDDTVLLSPRPGENGPLILKAGFSSMFRGYHGMPEETSERISGENFMTGDLVRMDSEGMIYYEGRTDDVINTSGHLVSPLEVEQTLTANPAVAAAAVVSEPDELIYEQPAAFLVLEKGFEWSRELESALRVAVNTGVSVYAVPKHYYIVEELPHTMSGKIDRASLRARLRSA